MGDATPPFARRRYCPRLMGSAPAKVRKSIMRKSLATRIEVFVASTGAFAELDPRKREPILRRHPTTT
jgi:hypothetical protein